MENILYVNTVQSKPFESGLFFLERCSILISQIKLQLLRMLKAYKIFLIQIRQKRYSSFYPIVLSF